MAALAGLDSKLMTPSKKNKYDAFNMRGRLWVKRMYGELRRSVYQKIDRQTVLKRDGYKCAVCGIKLNRKAIPLSPNNPTVDHIVPLSKGGTHTYDNLRACCLNCNSKKGDRLEIELEV